LGSQLRRKIFEVTAQYLSTFTGVAGTWPCRTSHKRLIGEDFGTYYNNLLYRLHA
jgi:hypothetical protein